MTYLVLPGLTVHGANAISCPLVVGYPAMTAFNGLVHHFTRQVATETAFDVQPQGFAVLHHAAQLRVHGRWRNRLTQKRFVHTDARTRRTGDRAHYMLTPSTVTMPELDMIVSLVIEVASEPGLSAAIDDIAQDTAALLGPKAFGGTVQNVGDLRFCQDLPTAIRGVPSCFVLFDRSMELCSDEADPLDRLLDLLTEQTAQDVPERRRLTPLQTGWRAISAQTWRETPRGAGFHSFAEPLLGLGEFVPRHIAMNSIETNVVWRAQLNNPFFTVKGYDHG